MTECLSRWPWRGPLYASTEVSDLMGKPLMRHITTEVAERNGLTMDALIGPRRGQRLALARFEAISRIYATKRFSTTQIGRFFNRDHSSITYALQRAQGLAPRDLNPAAYDRTEVWEAA